MSVRILLPCDTFEKDGHIYHQVMEKYVSAIVNVFSGIPLLIPAFPEKGNIQKLLDMADGVLLTGAYSNIEPLHYSGGLPYEGSPMDRARDGLTLGLIPEIIKRGIPLLAICRGFQELNVALGGALYQEVHATDGFFDHREPKPSLPDIAYDFAHSVSLNEGGLLRNLSGKFKEEVNSLHGQGIKQLAKGLRVEAVAPDGLIEAVSMEDSPGFVVGVQWHPEWNATEIPFYNKIFEAFGAACKKRGRG